MAWKRFTKSLGRAGVRKLLGMLVALGISIAVLYVAEKEPTYTLWSIVQKLRDG